MMELIKKERGFSLVEVLVSIAILAVVLVGVLSFVFWMNYYHARTKADREALENARRTMDTIVYEVKGAMGVYTPTTTQSQLSLETARYAASGETSSFIDFFLCDGALCLKKESLPPIAITPDSVVVSTLSFTQLMNGSIPSLQVHLVVDYKNPDNNQANSASADITSTVALRSY